MTEWHALETLDEAWEDTREILLPFNWKTWARLMIIVIFTGSGLGLPIGGSPSDTGEEDYSGSEFDAQQTQFNELSGSDLSNSITGLTFSEAGIRTAGMLVLGIIVLTVIFGLFYLTSVFEFIFYQSLLDRDIRIRNNFRKHSLHGLHYLFFRLSVSTVLLILLGAALIPLAFNPLIGGFTMLSWVLLLIPAYIFLGLTNNFILVRVIESDSGIIGSWKSFRENLVGQWQQLIFYIFIRFILKTAIGAIGLLWAILALLAVGIPTAIVGYGFYMLAEILAVIPVSIGIIIWLIAMLAFKVPAQTFLYHYAILVYREFTEVEVEDEE